MVDAVQHVLVDAVEVVLATVVASGMVPVVVPVALDALEVVQAARYL